MWLRISQRMRNPGHEGTPTEINQAQILAIQPLQSGHVTRADRNSFATICTWLHGCLACRVPKPCHGL
jgi:hypothetical protein